MSLPPPPRRRFQVSDNEAVSPEPLSFVTVRTAAFAAADRSVSFAAAPLRSPTSCLRDSEACGAVQPEGICLSVRLATLALAVNEGY